MSLAEAVRGKTRDPLPYRGAVSHAERRTFWVEHFEVEEECAGEPLQSIELIPTAGPVDSKILFLAVVKLPHSENLQVNFARYVRNAFVHMMSSQGLVWGEQSICARKQLSDWEHWFDPVEVRHHSREEEHAKETVLLKSAELLTEITNKPTNELVELLRKVLAPDISTRSSTKMQEVVLEAFTGYVDRVDGGIAYVRLKSRDFGDVLYGKYSAPELASKGIYEQGRFLCETVKVGNSTRLDLKALPDVEVSKEELRAMDERIHRVISRDDPGIEY